MSREPFIESPGLHIVLALHKRRVSGSVLKWEPPCPTFSFQALGVWYEYMYHTNPRQDPPDTNVMHNATATGTYAGTFHEPTRAISWITRFYRGRISSAEPLECGSITYQGNMTIHGKRATKALTGYLPGIIRKFHYDAKRMARQEPSASHGRMQTAFCPKNCRMGVIPDFTSS